MEYYRDSAPNIDSGTIDQMEAKKLRFGLTKQGDDDQMEAKKLRFGLTKQGDDGSIEEF
ncbi:8219_t:CDS:2 [Entrophospora sp. SA101]|nr:8219_t:CDS:2 [Entrophospora sp. SA101]CAJ0907311.1 137_t:CDS:2 [Entrophospora sp. SA101]